MTMTPETDNSYNNEDIYDRTLGIDASKLTITRTAVPKILKPAEELIFGTSFTDHMLSIEWTEAAGWLPPRIIPYDCLRIDPAACSLQYACECFEGMKAYKDRNGGVRLFRPDRNMVRLNSSAARIALPPVDEEALVALIAQFVLLEERFIPSARGYSLYLRPTMIATNASLGVRPPTSALLYVIASPAGPYHRAGFHAISLEATDAVRAWPGGSGDRKLGANYGPTLVAIAETTKRGFDHNLWLFGEEEYITEAGTMNIFIAIRSAETGQKELITPPLDGMILGGVTRDSILMLAREKFAPMGWLISERQLTMAQLAGAVDRGDLLEVFGTGTAAVVTSIHTISWRYRRLNLMNEAREEGEVASSMRRWIEARQYGDEEHHWSYLCGSGVPGEMAV